MGDSDVSTESEKVIDVDLMDRIKKSLKNLITLEIITTVGQVELTINEDNEISVTGIKDSKDCKSIWTTINLLEGDISTVYDPEYVTGQYHALRDFHKAREDQGHQIIKDNIAALKELYKLVSGELKDEENN